MDEFETRLRDGLTALADPVRPTVEAEALFGPGERLRRRRRLGLVAGATASILVIGLALSSLPWLRGASAPVVIATPSPTATSVRPTVPSDRASIDLKAVAHGLVDRVEASAEPSAGGLRVKVNVFGPAGVLLQSWTGEATADRPFEVAYDKGMWIGVLAHRVDDLMVVQADSSAGWFGSAYQTIPGVDGSLYVALANDGASQFADLLWRDPSGEYFDAAGKPLTTARVKVGDFSGWVFLDRARKAIRYQLGDWANKLDLGTSKLDCSAGSDSGDGGAASFEICLLPKGATDIRPKLGVNGERWQDYGLEDRTVLLVTGSNIETDHMIKSVTYRDLRGIEVTESLG